MEPSPNSQFSYQPSAASSSPSGMDLDPKAGEEPGGASADLDIKMEASEGPDGETSMADIPDVAPVATNIPAPVSANTTALPSKSEPGSSLPLSMLPQPASSSPSPPPPSKPTTALRAPRKKGNAMLVKKTTSRKAGSASRAGRGGRRRAGGAVKTVPDGEDGEDGGGGGRGGGGDEDDGASDHGPYCLCRGPDDHRWMIACDVCEDWFHGECVGVDKAVGEALIVRYVCPRCSDGAAGGVNVTRYKRTCSVDGCFQAARVYDDDAAGYSVFCSDRHAEDWWEALVRGLPENSRAVGGADGDELTREKFMGLLGVQTVRQSVEGEEPWCIGKKPFAVPTSFWSTVDPTLVLTPEEQAFLTASAADRYALAEEIVLNKKMQLLLDLANERRKAAIAVGLFDKDACGYDARLDVVGVPAEFALWARSAAGDAALRASSPPAAGAADGAAEGLCERRRCKPHAAWYSILTKSTRHVVKELAREAKARLDAETRVRDAAATRHFRRRHERTAVIALDGGEVV